MASQRIQTLIRNGRLVAYKFAGTYRVMREDLAEFRKANPHWPNPPGESQPP